eukprot:CAMPEP_0183569942 /NCGR_PEP_ID=MMETSP0371-20130417/121679_1 /TAXON_ID=268820 /ORGANISM="Peridinium aciculiferum, Strain PAER-2" /LENGTH=54 /DNA_ID=CAMNT_0025779569 /DNA_START=65 /DNA_END=226 /DNA_ORIENTATION=+
MEGEPVGDGQAPHRPPVEEEVHEREISASELEVTRKIGEGTTAVVFLGKLRGVV